MWIGFLRGGQPAKTGIRPRTRDLAVTHSANAGGRLNERQRTKRAIGEFKQRAETRPRKSASRSKASPGTPAQVRRANELITLSTSAVAVCCCRDFAQLVEQPRILDGDDGLRGEILDQFDLLVGEWQHLLADRWRSTPTSASSLNIGTTSKVRMPATSTPATGSGSPCRYDGSVRISATWIGWRPAVSTRQGTVRTGGAVQGSAAPLLDPGRWQIAMHCDRTEAIPFVQPQRAIAGFAELASPSPAWC